jgi:hypothetical protein
MVDFNSVQSLLLVWKPCVPSNHRSRPTETRSWRTLASIWPVIVDRNPVSNDQRGHPPSSGWRRPEHRQFWTLLAVETSILENALHAAGSNTRTKSPHRGQRRGRRPRRPPRGRTGLALLCVRRTAHRACARRATPGEPTRLGGLPIYEACIWECITRGRPIVLPQRDLQSSPAERPSGTTVLRREGIDHHE